MDLERTIADLVRRKNALPIDSAERQLIDRELTGLRYSYEEAGGIIGSRSRLGIYCSPLADIARDRAAASFAPP